MVFQSFSLPINPETCTAFPVTVLAVFIPFLTSGLTAVLSLAGSILLCRYAAPLSIRTVVLDAPAINPRETASAPENSCNPVIHKLQPSLRRFNIDHITQCLQYSIQVQ